MALAVIGQDDMHDAVACSRRARQTQQHTCTTQTQQRLGKRGGHTGSYLITACPWQFSEPIHCVSAASHSPNPSPQNASQTLHNRMTLTLSHASIHRPTSNTSDSLRPAENATRARARSASADTSPRLRASATASAWYLCNGSTCGGGGGEGRCW